MSKMLGGVICLKVNGKLYFATGDFKYGGGEIKRTEKLAHQGVLVFTGETTAAFIEGVIVKKDIGLKDIADIQDATITLDLPDGKTFTLYQAFSTNEKGIEASTEKGEISVKFVGCKHAEV